MSLNFEVNDGVRHVREPSDGIWSNGQVSPSPPLPITTHRTGSGPLTNNDTTHTQENSEKI